MSERVLNAVLTIKDALKYYHNKPDLVPINNELIALGQTAYSRYQIYLDDKNKKEAEDNKKKQDDEEIRIQEEENKKCQMKQKEKLENFKTKLKLKRKNENVIDNKSKKLFHEANEKLRKGLEKKNFEEIDLAHSMMAVVSNLEKDRENFKKEGEKIQNQIDLLEQSKKN